MKSLLNIIFFTITLIGLTTGAIIKPTENTQVAQRRAAKPATEAEIAAARELAINGFKGPSPQTYTTFRFYACDDIYWQGRCVYHVYDADEGACFNLPDDEQNEFSSIGPDQGYYCEFFTFTECRDEKLGMIYPGIANLVEVDHSEHGWSYYNDHIESYRCWRIPGFNYN